MAEDGFAGGLDYATRDRSDRRRFLKILAGTTAVTIFGGAPYVLAERARLEHLRSLKRKDGRPRVPPGQHVLEQLKPMGGEEGDPSPAAWRLRVHGAVEAPFELDFAALLAMKQEDLLLDVHCVTKWTVLDSHWQGVRLGELLDRARPTTRARFVLLEGPERYTANLDLAEARKPDVLVAHRLEGEPLARRNGAPVRAVVPDRYFWKSTKWLTGIRVIERDQPGYWETRGYHNHADPWREERYG